MKKEIICSYSTVLVLQNLQKMIEVIFGKATITSFTLSKGPNVMMESSAYGGYITSGVHSMYYINGVFKTFNGEFLFDIKLLLIEFTKGEFFISPDRPHYIETAECFTDGSSQNHIAWFKRDGTVHTSKYGDSDHSYSSVVGDSANNRWCVPFLPTPSESTWEI